MVSTAVDDDKDVHKALAELAQKAERLISYALRELGESGTDELGPGKYLLRNKKARDETMRTVHARFAAKISEWQHTFPDGKEIVFFEALRRRCYDLYEMTNAWDTIFVLAAEISEAINSQLEKKATAGDRMLLRAIRLFLDLLKPDMAVFQGLNRGSNHSTIENSGVTQDQARELIDVLDPGGRGEEFPELDDDQARLRKQLLAEAHALQGVYQGVYCAAVALADHEAAIREYYDENPGPDEGGPLARFAGHRSGHWPDHRVTRNLHDARDQVRNINRGLEEDHRKRARALTPDAAERAVILASRLKPWESLLSSVAAAYADSKPMRLPTVHLRYCFPFAVKTDKAAVGKLSSALRKRIPGVDAMVDEDEEADGATPRLDTVLDDTLLDLGHGAATVTALELTDFWAGAGEGMYGGNRVTLPTLSDRNHPADEWRAWIDLSRLENHCLCIERTLTDPTPHELYKALRCPADYSRFSDYRYGWTKTRSCYWRGLDEFAHDVILKVAESLTQGEKKKDEKPKYVKGHFHVIALVDSDVSSTNLDGLYGAELLRTNVNRDAATLEEWVRYPAAKHRGNPDIAQGNFGYKENWWAVLDDTTIFGVVGNPSWQADSYREAVQFAASWTPRLLLWNRELMQELEPRSVKNKKDLSDLRDLEQTVRRSVASAHAEELCRLRPDRRYLEWLMEAVGTTAIQEDLERRIHTMRLLIDETEKKEQDRMDVRRNFFLGAIAVFGVLNVSTVFAVLDAGDNSGFFKSHAAIRDELIVQVVILVVVFAAFFVVGQGRWKWHWGRN
jgi:hypothetical protein